MSGHIYLILACICYSFEWWMIEKLHILGSTSIEIAFYKGFFVVSILGVYYLFTGQLRKHFLTLKKSYLLPLLLFSFIFIYGNTAYAEALRQTKVMNVLILSYLSIFLGLYVGTVLFSEKAKSILPYAILAFAGIILTLYNGEFSFQFGLGEVLALTIALTLTATMTIVKLTPEVNPWFRLFVAYAIGTVCIAGYLVYEGMFYRLFMSPPLITMGAIYAIATGLLGRGLKDLGTKTVPMGMVGIIMLLEPILQIITAGIWGNQIPILINLIGIMAVFGSIIGVLFQENL